MKKRILFVDDEVKILDGLKRLLRPMKDEWEMKFVISGKEALNILEQEPFDIVISDMRMPGMNGVQLLSEVKRLYPQIVRIILSGHSDQEMILKSVQVTHQFLSKPCGINTLKATISHTCGLQDMLKQENLKILISNISTIPSLPTLYKQLHDELRSNKVSIERVSQIIASDIAMTAKILQLINSAFFGLKREVQSVEEAVVLLGIDIIKALVLSIEVFSQFDQNLTHKFSVKKLLDHSIICANYAKIIAKIEKADKITINNSFMAGILHDIGKLLIIANLPKKYEEIINTMKEKNISFWEAENIVLETSHAEVGAYLIKLWGFPDDIVDAIAFHHKPLKSQHKKFCPLTGVHAANSIYYEKYPEDNISNKISIDTEYLKNINLLNNFSVWRETCLKLDK